MQRNATERVALKLYLQQRQTREELLQLQQEAAIREQELRNRHSEIQTLKRQLDSMKDTLLGEELERKAVQRRLDKMRER